MSENKEEVPDKKKLRCKICGLTPCSPMSDLHDDDFAKEIEKHEKEMEEREKKKMVKIEAYDHFNQKLDSPYDIEGATAIMTTIGELYEETDTYYIVRSCYFEDEDKDNIGYMAFQWVLKAAVISIIEYTQEGS